jgi:hypothetical protein
MLLITRLPPHDRQGIRTCYGEFRLYRFPDQGGVTYMIQPGEHAPDFTLESTQGPFILSSLKSEKHAVLIFYPKDNTPG